MNSGRESAAAAFAQRLAHAWHMSRDATRATFDRKDTVNVLGSKRWITTEINKASRHSHWSCQAMAEDWYLEPGTVTIVKIKLRRVGDSAWHLPPTRTHSKNIAAVMSCCYYRLPYCASARKRRTRWHLYDCAVKLQLRVSPSCTLGPRKRFSQQPPTTPETWPAARLCDRTGAWSRTFSACCECGPGASPLSKLVSMPMMYCSYTAMSCEDSSPDIQRHTSNSQTSCNAACTP